MKACIDRLRTALVGLLAVALLFGPCLSISGFTGSGAAHAHAAHENGGASEHGPGHAAHGAMQGEQADGGSRHDAPPGCEQMCDGWAVQKSKDDLPKAVLATPVRHGSGDDAPLAILLSDRSPTGPPGHYRSIPYPVAQDAWFSGVRHFALTSRYRL